MKSRKLYWWKAIASFMFVLLMMPLGHALMILMEQIMNETVLHYAAFLMGGIGLGIVIAGVFLRGDTRQTLFGLIGGLLFWTGWVEFLFSYYANRYGTQPQLDPTTGEIITRPEYLILPATFGFWIMIMTLYIFCTPTGCNFINWIQTRLFGVRKKDILYRPMTRHTSIVTFMELNMILWTSYLLLMFCYDERFIGDSSLITFGIGALCLAGSLYVFVKQLRISSWGRNIRMAIATVILFWTPVEILGRNNFFEEIWIAPLKHMQEMCIIFVGFIILGTYLILKSRKSKTLEK